MYADSQKGRFRYQDLPTYPSLYHPSFEHDACGIGAIAHIEGEKSHRLIEDALRMLENMEHRGATGADPDTGDGAGILLQVDHDFMCEMVERQGFSLPEYGKYGVGMCFFPKNETERLEAQESLERIALDNGFQILGYRKVPTLAHFAAIGKAAYRTEPHVDMVFVQPKSVLKPAQLERKLYVLRKVSEKYFVGKYKEEIYFPSFSHKTIIYKGQLTTYQLRLYYADLQDNRLRSSLAIVHSRFSTNTFPRWSLAQPFHLLAHNGEINTHRGNMNWLKTKEAVFDSTFFEDDDMRHIKPICDEARSDSSNLDAVAELLLMAGRPLEHVMMMLMPEAWQNDPMMSPEKKAFYEYHMGLTEPWDGPAALCFTDGEKLGACLDRNGLRPSRYILTKDKRLILASEAGALPVEPAMIQAKGRLGAGKMIMTDPQKGILLLDQEIKEKITQDRPYQQWLKEGTLRLENLKAPVNGFHQYKDKLITRQSLFGITEEEIKYILIPMAQGGKEPIGSMGVDNPLAILSTRTQHFSHYFKQLFAQVSNPPIDPIRERVVMSLQTWIGGSKNFLEETPDHCRHIALESPIIDNQDIEKLKEIDVLGFSTKVIPIKFKLGTSLEEELEKLVIEAENALEQKHNILILSDRYLASNELPIPALLALGAVHHHLIRQGKRHLTALVVETGDVREVHHVATLIGFGAVAINPYLVFESLDVLAETEAFLHVGRETLHTNYRKAIDKGMLKVMSKMGISTLQSYHGAQIFEILGLAQPLVERYFKGTVSRMGGMDLVGVQKEVTARYRFARHVAGQKLGRLAEGSRLQWKQKGEYHIYNPESIHLLQKATKTGDYKLFKKYSALINGRDKKIASLRSLLDFVPSEEIPLEEVEPVREILKRFATGAMSFGSISHEAHTALAIAMNKIGGKSNSGEGGEDPMRFPPKPNGDWERSAIKQVASGRFGVSLHYLSEADELQIKIAQGAKPGEGGHLPGYKVDEWIARVRNSTPGVGLISPPPHHDIYSIEDLAQLISDLKNANRFARISVKLVSKAGVGTIASGVAKAFADHILISGYDGGTGAAPLSSIQHAGLPWELGLAETHQTLVHNRLRDRVTLQADGGMKTGRDLAIATLLGAEEWGIATAALIVEGCILTRKCHLNSCPVGIATQDPDLRKRFTGQVGHLIHFFTFLARELREYMAMLGFRTVDAMVGQAQRLKVRDDLAHWKHKSLDLRPILGRKEGETRLYKQVEQKHKLQQILDRDLIASCQPAIQEGKYVHLSYPIANTYRSVGTMLSHEIIRQTEGKCLEPNTINLKFKGSAGQSFGAFAIKGITFELEGEANDYVGKGLSGAQIIVYPHKSVTYSPGENIIIGNVALYGATAGEMFIRGMVGERFAVRNSGASAVVEGLGDHGCEYMTGGRVIVLGKTGKNFAAGMSGGIAYVYDEVGDFEEKVNKEMVIVHDPLDEEDRTCIYRLVKRHAALTGSRVAKKIIDTWDAELDKIVKVIPTKFKEMQAIQKATQTFVAPTLRS